MIYRDIINYTTIIMKNKSRNYFKKTKNIFDNNDNTFSDYSNNIKINENPDKSNNYNINYNAISNSNELSFLIFSSNKDTNKYKRDVLFGDLLSMSKQKDELSFNSLMRDYSFKKPNINIYLDNNDNLNHFLTSEKNKIKNNELKINQLSSIKNKNINTTIKRDYNNLFDNENNFNLNDYLDLYKNDKNDKNDKDDKNDKNDKNDDNIENNFSNEVSPKESISPIHQIKDLSKNSPNINNNIKKKNNLETIIEERKKESKKKNKILNEELFNTHIKEKISKIKEDIINNNNIKQKKEINRNININKYINSKLKIDKYIDYYELMYKELEQRDESKELENIFSEFFTIIRYKFCKKKFYNDFIDSLNNCKLYDLIKLNKENKNTNCFNVLMSNMELSNNKNLSNSNSYLYNSKSEILRDGSHSLNDSHSSQIIENHIEKNIPIISKFPKLTIPQSIIPEESSNFLYSNNDYILNRSLGEPIEENNKNYNLMEVQEVEEEKNILFEENINKELNKIENNGEININNIFDYLNLNNIFDEENQIDDDNIKEYKSKIFYNILLISQNNNINIIQKNPFSKIIKVN